MRKHVLTVATLAMLLGTVACKSKSSFESDVQKRADYMCKIQRLEAKAGSDEKAAKEVEALKKEMDEFDNKMEAKYKGKEPTDKQQEAARKIIEETMAKCK